MSPTDPMRRLIDAYRFAFGGRPRYIRRQDRWIFEDGTRRLEIAGSAMRSLDADAIPEIVRVHPFVSSLELEFALAHPFGPPEPADAD